MSDVEQIMVVPTLLFHEVGHFQGFCENVDPYLKTLLDPAHTRYEPRPQMEEDPSFKQLIPYCIFRCDGKIFNYVRGGSGGESRLHAKKSVGIGGHISAEDEGGDSEPYLVGMQRELDEEVRIESPFSEQLVGLINDDETEVGKVHLGIVHIFDLEEPKVFPAEESIQETGFAQPEQLLDQIDTFETWSQICLQHLFGR
jgi:predicted NUDIX family phosphoesterase